MTGADMAGPFERFAEALRAHTARTPALPAVTDPTGTLTWAELHDRVIALSGPLATRAERAGSTRVGVMLLNTVDHIAVTYACLWAGLHPVNVNYRYTPAEVRQLSDIAGLGFIVAGERFANSSENDVAAVSVDDLVSESAPGVARTPSLSDGAYYYATGGTTGLPKLVEHREAALLEYLFGLVPEVCGFDPAASRRDGGQLVTMPLSPLIHAAAMWAGAMATHLHGGHVVLESSFSFDAHRCLRMMERARPSYLVVVGEAFARRLLAAIDERPPAADVLASVRNILTSGAPLSRHARRELHHVFRNAAISEVFAATEGSYGRMTTHCADDCLEPGVFRLGPDAALLAPSGLKVLTEPGDVGLLASGALVPRGYEASDRRLVHVVGGRAYSVPGDFAQMRSDGLVQFVGRGSGIINVAGEKVYAEEVEALLRDDPAVTDCAVFGCLVDGVEVVAAVVSVSREVHVNEAVAALAPYKRPRRVAFVDAVPRTVVGKVDLDACRALVQHEMVA